MLSFLFSSVCSAELAIRHQGKVCFYTIVLYVTHLWKSMDTYFFINKISFVFKIFFQDFQGSKLLISCLVKFASKIHTENSARSIVLIFYFLCWMFIIKSSKDSQNVTRKGKANVLLLQQKILLLQVICRRQTHVTKRRCKIFGRGRYFKFKGKSLLTILVKDLQLLDQK